MLNLNYNIIGAGGFDRYSKEESKGFIPFQVQYVVVAGGGGSAGGGNLKAGQAGNGGQIVQGGYCVQPFATYSINIGQGGNGGAVSGSLAITTGSIGQTSSFATITASAGQGGVYQNAVTLSFFGGGGNNGFFPPSNGNGGSGSQWTYNLAGCLPPFEGCHGGEYITSSYYAGGGAGFIVGPPVIEYMIIGGGGGGGAKVAIATTSNTSYGGGGFGGQWNTGSFTAFPSESYAISIGKGGANATNWGSPNGTGSYGQSSSISGSIVTTPLLVTSSGGQGGSWDSIGGGSGGGIYPFSSSVDLNGANGIQWKDGFYYGGGGGAAADNPNPGNGLGGWGGGGNGGGSTSTGSFGGNDVTNYPFGIYSGPPGLSSQVLRNDFGNGMGAGASGLRQLVNAGSGSGGNGTVVLRYAGTPVATGGTIVTSGSFTYHYFASSSNFNLTLSDLLIRPGSPGESGAVTGSNGTNNTGGGAGGTFYNQSGSKGGSGFVALRYEGAPIASGGQIIGTDHYTYHIYTASGEFYAIGQETNPNINPCP
jgi:hypothetical protein